MKKLRLSIAPVVVLAGFSLLPSPARAEQIPICFPSQSSTLCYYAVDLGDCYVEGGIRRCRTTAIYLWEQGV